LGPEPIPFDISFSYMNRYNSREALADGLAPDGSDDEDISSFTWWAHKGTAEWVQYTFPAEKELSRTSIYWLDDEADGE